MWGLCPMKAEDAAAAFWEWSLAVYAHDEVKDTLLTLQDRHHLNVNVMLWCIWAARQGWAFETKQVQLITDAVDPFSRYGIERLREVRRYLSSPKPGFDEAALRELRQDLLLVELKGERLVQTRLAELTVELGGSPVPPARRETDEIARRHFRNVGPSLEKPVLLADSHGSAAAGELFDRLLELTALEETA